MASTVLYLHVQILLSRVFGAAGDDIKSSCAEVEVSRPWFIFLVLRSGDKGLRGNTLVERRREPATTRRWFPSILRGDPPWSEDPGLTDTGGLTAFISIFLLKFSVAI